MVQKHGKDGTKTRFSEVRKILSIFYGQILPKRKITTILYMYMEETSYVLLEKDEVQKNN